VTELLQHLKQLVHEFLVPRNFHKSVAELPRALSLTTTSTCCSTGVSCVGRLLALARVWIECVGLVVHASDLVCEGGRCVGALRVIFGVWVVLVVILGYAALAACSTWGNLWLAMLAYSALVPQTLANLLRQFFAAH
jgi:hypothetical protein